MKKIALIACAVLLVMIVIGGIVLASITIPAPTGKIEKPVPEEKLAK